jgi:hypothetical protein
VQFIKQRRISKLPAKKSSAAHLAETSGDLTDEFLAGEVRPRADPQQCGTVAVGVRASRPDVPGRFLSDVPLSEESTMFRNLFGLGRKQRSPQSRVPAASRSFGPRRTLL